MSEQPSGESTDEIICSSSHDEILHRAFSLPEKYPKGIVIAGWKDGHIETRYSFEAAPLIGEGGYAVVYRVRDVRLNVVRALKVLFVDLRSDPEAERRWQCERELLLALENINARCVPTIYDVGVVNGLPVIVMHFIDGDTLEHKIATSVDLTLKKSSIESAEKHLRFVISVVEPLVSSLAYIEKQFAGTKYEGFAHGDIKPANIVVETKVPDGMGGASFEIGRVWLLDFGEASVRYDAEKRGLTLKYASPEQKSDWEAGRPSIISPATDQYQLGIVLQELLKPVVSLYIGDRWPFPKAQDWSSVGDDFRQMAMRSQINSFSILVQRMTARLPSDRYPNFLSLSKYLQGSLRMFWSDLDDAKAQDRWTPPKNWKAPG